MNNYILISKTFVEWTTESAEEGDFSNSDFITEREEVSFSELVKLMEEHQHPSRSGSVKYYGPDVWYSTGSYCSDYRTGTDREESIHYHHDNTPNAAKYWKYARIAADKRREKRLQNI